MSEENSTKHESEGSSESGKKLSKKIIALLTVIVLVLVGLGWYFLYFIKTPVYSLNIIREAVAQHDVNKFNKHVDVDNILNKGFDDAITAMIDSDKKTDANTKIFAKGLAQMFKAPVVGMAKEAINKYVEKGKWQEEPDKNSENNGNKAPMKATGVNPDNFADKVGLKESKIKDIAYTKTDGDIAIVGIKIFDEKVNKDFIAEIKMKKLNDGTWQITEFANLKEYITTIQEAKNNNQQ